MHSMRRANQRNLHYRNGADMQLFVREIVEVLTKITADSGAAKKKKPMIVKKV